MKIILATPLYPPDINQSAVYTKELALRLCKAHEVIIVTYGHLPENVSGVSFLCADKRRPTLFRLIHFTFLLWKAAREADVVYAQNGPSVELPLDLVAPLLRCPIIFQISDEAAHRRAQQNVLLKMIERFACRNASKVMIDDLPIPKPEILPFRSIPQKELVAYEDSWKSHIAALENNFTHAT